MNPTLSDIVSAAQQVPPRCADTRVIAVDGPAGSGKTTLAARLGERLGAQVLHADDMYEGWDGLDTLDAVLVDQVLAPLAARESAGFSRWDWVASERVERIDIPAAPWLIVEGVGSGSRAARTYLAALVWVEAPWELRLRRGLERDGDHMRAQWETWQVAEHEHFTNSATREAASFIVDGTAPIVEADRRDR